jgi:putative membrane protein
VWIALDWPVGTLGGGYLASAHALQFVLLAQAAPALLLLGLRPRVASAVERRPALAARLGAAAHPVTGLLVYNVILVVTHFPGVVDRLMATQLGSFTVDMLWITAGLALWWPVAAPPRLLRVSPPIRMGYLFLQTIPATFPAAFLTFSSHPLYRLYELAPRTHPLLNPGWDHQLAGLIMKVIGDPILWLGIAAIYFRWARAEQRADLEAQAGLPRPRARV